MKILFTFFCRLLLTFLVAKLLLGVLGGGGPAALLGLALALLALTYLIPCLEKYYQRSWQSKMVELGWRVARFLIGLNQLKGKKP